MCLGLYNQLQSTNLEQYASAVCHTIQDMDQSHASHWCQSITVETFSNRRRTFQLKSLCLNVAASGTRSLIPQNIDTAYKKKITVIPKNGPVNRVHEAVAQ
jgi:hypothetical protein